MEEQHSGDKTLWMLSLLTTYFMLHKDERSIVCVKIVKINTLRVVIWFMVGNQLHAYKMCGLL